MALYELATHETDTMLVLGPDAVEVRCDRCEMEAFPHLCFAEYERGKHHHHGQVHDLQDGSWKLVALCDDCHLDYAIKTTEQKRNNVAAREGVRT